MRLRAAAERGDLAACVEELERGASVDDGGKTNWSALHRAAERGHVEVVLLLLKFGAHKSLPTLLSGDTPLHLAVERGHVRVVHELLLAGAGTLVMNRAGKTPLQLAMGSRHSSPEIVRALLDAGAAPDMGRAVAIIPNNRDHTFQHTGVVPGIVSRNEPETSGGAMLLQPTAATHTTHPRGAQPVASVTARMLARHTEKPSNAQNLESLAGLSVAKTSAPRSALGPGYSLPSSPRTMMNARLVTKSGLPRRSTSVSSPRSMVRGGGETAAGSAAYNTPKPAKSYEFADDYLGSTAPNVSGGTRWSAVSRGTAESSPSSAPLANFVALGTGNGYSPRSREAVLQRGRGEAERRAAQLARRHFDDEHTRLVSQRNAAARRAQRAQTVHTILK